MARLAYLGTPEFAVPPLRALVRVGHEITMVVSGPDRKRGRGAALSPSPVKAAATELGLSTSSDLSDLTAPGVEPPELGVVVAFGRLIRPATLAAVPMVNLHLSLLPRWRGAAPLERAILAGDPTIGVCVMAVEAGLDTGPVYARSELAIGPDEHLGPLRDRLIEAGSRLLVAAVAHGAAGLPEPVPQEGEATYAKKIEPGELEIDWSAPSAQVLAVVRLDKAFSFVGRKRLRVLEAGPAPSHHPAAGVAPGTLASGLVATGDGAVRLETVQPEGGRPMSVQEWLRGGRLPEQVRLGRAR
ncbi:MAG: methionyl-tRNA formyltransferase [Acidimicrobiales bacterium]